MPRERGESMRAGLTPVSGRITRHAALLICILGTIALTAIQRASVPRGVSFNPNDAANLTFDGKVGERCERSFVIRNETSSDITVRSVRLNADDNWVDIEDRKGKVLAPGAEYIVRMVFQPKAAGVSTQARLTFSVRLSASQVRSGEVQFVGKEGVSCLPPPDAPGGGGAVPDGNTGVGIPGFDDFGAVPQDEQQQTICVRFHYVTEGWTDPTDRPTNEELQRCLRAASGWFRGVEFRPEPADAAPDEVAGLNNDATDDPHCINIYIVHGQWFETHRGDDDTAAEARERLGETEGLPAPRTKAWDGTPAEPGVKQDLEAAGVNGDYLNQLGPGRRITAEASEQLCSTIAHELGHVLGLGRGPGGTHLQPDDGQEIGDAARLMHEQGQGSRLSDGEQTVATRLARYINEYMLTRCNRSFRTLEDSRSALPPRNDLRSAGIYNQRETLRLVATTNRDIDTRTFNGRLTAEFDTNLDGTADQRIVQTYADGEWRTSSEPAANDSLVVPAAGFLTRTHAASGRYSRGITFEVPADFFPEAREIGWRVTLEDNGADLRSSLPASGFDRFDITTPDFAIDLDPDSRTLRVQPGQSFELSGTTAASSTFSGDLRMLVTLKAGEQLFRLPLPALASPLPASWSARVELPDSIRPGDYKMTVYALCDDCRQSTNLRGELDVGGGRAFPIARWILLAVALAVVGFILVLMARRSRRSEQRQG